MHFIRSPTVKAVSPCFRFFHFCKMTTQVEPKSFRVEKDTMGTIEVESSRYWGAQTERSRRNFVIGGERMPLPLIHAFALQKSIAAQVNGELGAD